MKKAVFILLLCGWAFISNAQTTKQEMPASSSAASVEKSIFGVQTGFLGIWFNNESRLSNRFAIRSEVGIETTHFSPGDSFSKAVFVLSPAFILEPRWYYNLNKRKAASKRIDGNSGNFISLQTRFIPDWFVISDYKYESTQSQLWIMPMWGIRRNIGRHFNYEAGIGMGYIFYFKSKNYSKSYSQFVPNILLRIGYRF